MTSALHPGIRVSEIFGPTIQGEGMLIGLPTVFVRTGGCDYRCSWCDSLHAVDSRFRHDWEMMSPDAVWQKVIALSGGQPVMVSLSGGNPAIQPLGPLIDRGHGEGYRFALETQGSVPKQWFADLDVLVLSPKPPSSEMTTDWAAFDTDPLVPLLIAGYPLPPEVPMPTPPTFDTHKISEFAHWQLACVDNLTKTGQGDDPRDIVAFVSHLRALGADYKNPTDYGMPFPKA